MRRPSIRAFWASLTPGQRRTAAMMAVVVAGLHVLGFALLIVLVAPHHYRVGSGGAFSIGLGLTAYTLGIRHAFYADHGLTGSFWAWLENVNINVLGFVIVGLFALTWGVALAVWRWGRIEERWTPRVEEPGTLR